MIFILNWFAKREENGDKNNQKLIETSSLQHINVLCLYMIYSEETWGTLFVFVSVACGNRMTTANRIE